jgi:hypothetical protein
MLILTAECRGRVVNTPSYSGGTGFKLWPVDQPFCLRAFVAFPHFLQVHAGIAT